MIIVLVILIILLVLLGLPIFAGIMAAAMLGLPPTTFEDRVLRGELAYVVVGGGRHRVHRRFRPADLEAWARHHRIPAAWETDSRESGSER